MLECENYKMFRGEMLITPVISKIKPFYIEGTWLYKPEYDCWYCNGSSYSANICTIVEDNEE